MMLRLSAVRNSRQDQDFADNEEGMRYARADEQEKMYDNLAINITDRTPLTWKHLAFVLFGLFLLKAAIQYEVHRLPPVPDPASLGVASDAVNKVVLDTDQFVASRARRYLNRLTSLGIRLAGSPVADAASVHLLLGELDDLRQQLAANTGLPHKLTFAADRVSGFFDLPFLSGFTSVYTNISNVLARLDPVSGNTQHALLINCHFDSYFETVGASDDAVNCALMLEILRALLSSKTPLKHSIIFLFNGAEESILQASHGFVAGASQAGGGDEGTGHPWMKHVRAFVNLEAAGAGGREILFQTGPGPATPILLRAYASAVPYPFSSVLGQEVFQAGIIPSDTDFRIFRDHGHLPGFDFAFYTNGFVYHTKYDSPDRIPDGSLQGTGENILSLVRALASSDLASIPPVGDPNDNSGEKLVFFDIFSSYFVVYPFRTVGLFLNFLAAGGAVYRIFSTISRSNRRDADSYKSILFSAVLAHGQAIVVAGVVLFGVATLLSASPSCMAWYSRPYLIYPLYVLPAVSSVFIVHAVYLKFYMLPKCTSSNLNQNCERMYSISIDAALVICTFGLVVLSFFSIASSYILCIWVGFPVLYSTLMDRLVPIGKRTVKADTSEAALLFRHGLVTIIPTIYHLYITDAMCELFVPIMGRVGVHVNPEYFIAVVVILTVTIPFMFHSSLVYLTGGQLITLIQIFAGFFGFVVITVLLTPFGNAYSLDATRYDGVHVQRSATQLTLQRIVSTPGRESEDKIRSGLWFAPLDFNGISSLRGYSKKLDQFVLKARLACSTDDDPMYQPYCGLPYVFPITQFVGGKTWWIDHEVSPETVKESYWPTIKQMPLSPHMITAGRWLMQFQVDCGDSPQCSLFIVPQSHAVILKWYFSTTPYAINTFPMDKLVRPPPATDVEPRPTWFIMLRFGTSSDESVGKEQRSIFVTLELGASGYSAASGKLLMDLAVASHYFRGLASDPDFRELPVELRAFTTALPPWHYTLPLTSLYAAYAF